MCYCARFERNKKKHTHTPDSRTHAGKRERERDDAYMFNFNDVIQFDEYIARNEFGAGIHTIYIFLMLFECGLKAHQ